MKYIDTINYYTNLITQTIKQSFLNKYLDEPELEIHKMITLHELVQDKPNYEELVQTTMLVQIALNTHDKVSINFEEENIRKQQLTVLAGDYYSGIYYHLLANHNNLTFIRLLADGINEMTQAKMAFYYSDFKDLDSFLIDYKEIESKLIEKVAFFVNKSDQIPYITTWLLAKRLEYELIQLSNGKGTFFHKLVMENVQSIQNNEQLEKKLRQHLIKINQDLAEIIADNKKNLVIPKNLDLFNYYALQKKWNMVLEEGLSQ
ncbi:heptaprenyl diphosphate synthase [Gracilibacillus orientalis]|uniref:Heptaprenyl diphosphate synthase n=1 Tax=Gracilibacillus orientalis TaxID=334253 RepID=A0A1I4L276_9BACI|nr:heptaprenyl diphosphate synthase component 1 [Gracilibacillus orientalis]SFL84986.1 heptaprenyl diphosphate synthase [Gracilibacillus orientalis]